MERQIIIVIVLVILVVLTGVQAVQLYNLKSAVADGKASFGPSQASGATLPSSIDKLPPMVGGC